MGKLLITSNDAARACLNDTRGAFIRLSNIAFTKYKKIYLIKKC